MKKWIIGITLVIVVIGIGAGIFIWRSFGQALYTPGMVSAGENLRAPLTPPQQSGAEDFWQVEPDIELHHFDVGEGRNVLVVHGGPGMPYTEAWPGLEPLTDGFRFHYYDQRGSGLSTRPIDSFDSSNYYENVTALDQTLGLGAQVADIERIRQILGEEKLILIGHSFGGFIASLYAAEFPDNVEALISLPRPMYWSCPRKMANYSVRCASNYPLTCFQNMMPIWRPILTSATSSQIRKKTSLP